MIGNRNKNYSLYLAGVINECQYYTNELDDHMDHLQKFANVINFYAESEIDKCISLLNEDSSLSPDEKNEAKSVVGWFKSKLDVMKNSINEYLKKGNDFILDKAFRVLRAAEKWGGYYVDESGQIEYYANEDAKKYEKDAKEIRDIFDRATAQPDKRSTLDIMQGKKFKTIYDESIMGSIGKFVSMKAFKLIKFILTDVVDVLLRTTINVFKSIMTPQAQGLKMLVSLMLAVVYPLVGFFGTGGGATFFLIPAGLFYIVMLIKAIYQHITGKPYLAAA
jgi:hypothetical protein